MLTKRRQDKTQSKNEKFKDDKDIFYSSLRDITRKHEFFMEKAAEIAQKSSMQQKHGAVIVYKNNIIGTGFNYNCSYMYNNYSIRGKYFGFYHHDIRHENEKNIFLDKFKTRWFVDLEIISRKIEKREKYLSIWEEPINYWKEIKGSKIKGIEIFRILKEILIITKILRRVTKWT